MNFVVDIIILFFTPDFLQYTGLNLHNTIIYEENSRKSHGKTVEYTCILSYNTNADSIKEVSYES